MRGLMTKTAVALLATAMLGAPAYANNGNGNGNGNGGGNGNGHGAADGAGASGMAPGHMKSDGESARDFAPGRVDGEARSFAPGQLMKADEEDGLDEDVTASTDDSNYGRLISLLRSERGDLGDLPEDFTVSIIDIDNVVPNGNRQALDNALEAQAAYVSELRDDLDALDAEELDDVDPDAVVAAEVAADGTLVVYVDE